MEPDQTTKATPAVEVTPVDDSPEAQTQQEESEGPQDEPAQPDPVPEQGDEPASDTQAGETVAGEGELTGDGEASQEGQDEQSAAADPEAPTEETGPAGETGESESHDQDPGEEGGEQPPAAEPPAAGQGETTGEDLPEISVEAPEGETSSDVEKLEVGEPLEGEPAPASEGEQTQDGETVEPADDGEKPPSPVPQSDTFAEGERPESPGMAVGERLSREGSPTEQRPDSEQTQPEPLQPGTPDRVSEAGDEVSHPELLEEDEEEDEEDEEPEIDREQLIERYHAAIAERDQLQQQNYQLQHKIAEYFRKKKSDDSRQDFDKNISDQEQRYIKYMANLEELRKQEGHERENYRVQIEELKGRCQDKQKRVDDERERFMEFKKQVALNSLNSRSGKPIPPKDIEQYLSTENRKDSDVVNVRLENIKLKNKLKKKELQLKSKEELAEGLHLIDFEQLKIENQTYNEKIEERNEELLKLRKKITSTVQVLTHLKEKLQFVQAENQVQNGRLKEVEFTAAKKRDILSRTKQARDALRIDNQKLRQNSGLLGNEPLLRDFEERKDESDDLTLQLEHLKMQHAELTLNCNQVRRKIDQVRMSQS